MTQFMEPFFVGQPRIPCSYLDEEDYIQGSVEKMESMLPVVEAKGDRLVVVVNSPGAALIGDDVMGAIERKGFSDKMMVIGESTFSTPASTAFDSTIRSIVSWLDPPRNDRLPASVNILGLSIINKDWRHGVFDLRGLLQRMGLTVISTPGVSCTVEDLRASSRAAYNVMVSPEYCASTAQMYDEMYGIPCIRSEEGAPVGFAATEHWLLTIASATGTDATEAIASLRYYRQMATSFLREFQRHSTLPKGATFAVKADASVALPLTKWLLQYLGMVPVAVQLNPGEDQAAASSLRSFLEEQGFGEAWNKDLREGRPDVVLADGHTARLMKGMRSCRVGVDISLPSLDRFNFIPRTIFGAQGSMYLLDEIINGI
jgi:nitrogenase molybdenum-iron protein alpha/beta subunit